MFADVNTMHTEISAQLKHIEGERILFVTTLAKRNTLLSHVTRRGFVGLTDISEETTDPFSPHKSLLRGQHIFPKRR
jgi:hypothetical protein